MTSLGTMSGRINQVELWFGKIERDVIARGVFTSVPDLKRKLMRYIRQYNKPAKPREMEVLRPISGLSRSSSIAIDIVGREGESGREVRDLVLPRSYGLKKA